MDSKFQEISRFLDGLEKSNLINGEEQALLLIGGNSPAVKTNSPCTNNLCSNSPCMNPDGCTNTSCSNVGCTNEGCN